MIELPLRRSLRSRFMLLRAQFTLRYKLRAHVGGYPRASVGTLRIQIRLPTHSFTNVAVRCLSKERLQPGGNSRVIPSVSQVANDRIVSIKKR